MKFVVGDREPGTRRQYGVSAGAVPFTGAMSCARTVSFAGAVPFTGAMSFAGALAGPASHTARAPARAPVMLLGRSEG